MAQRLLLEGLDPQAILQRAHEDFGPGVSVVQAERVRTGGVLGFFARETYALTVEVPDAPAEQPGGAADAQMAQEIADVERARRELVTGLPDDAGVEQAGTFEEAFAALTGERRDGDASTRTFAPASFPTVGAGAAVSVVGRRDHSRTETTVVTTRSETDVSATVESPVPLRIAETTIGSSGLRLHAWGAQHESVQAATLGPTVAALLALGVPAGLLPAGVRTDTRVPLHEVAARLSAPRARRLAPGSVLVVVGDPDAAFRVATQTALWAGVPITDVVLAGQCTAVPGHGRRVLTPASAARTRDRAELSARAGLPLIVAVGTAAGRLGIEAAAPLVAALQADVTWAAVDVSGHDPQRDADLALLAGRAGCDAIAAIGLAQSPAPATVLDAPLPVAWMDGVPASSVAWAALLGERIADAAERSPHAGRDGMSNGEPMSR